MSEDKVQPESDNGNDEINSNILENIQAILDLLKVSKVFLIDDAINQDTGKGTFKGIVQSIIASGKIAELGKIQIQGIDFTTHEAVLFDHIDEVWDSLKRGKQLRYFERVYEIDDKPQAINDLNVSNNLKEFFTSGKVTFLTPTEWDDQIDKILSEVDPGSRVIILFDQDLKLAGGRYSDHTIQGEQLILELKQKGESDKFIVSLLTHTTTTCDQELTKRAEICEKYEGLLNISDFFVLAKSRLAKPEMFADGLKKISLNTFCEKIKLQTIEILRVSQAETLKQLADFDTYDFDHTVFKSSHVEGVWEPETLLRITDVIFKDEVRKQMIARDYVGQTNPIICSANEISKIEFKMDDSISPYNERIKLRNKEIYESGILINRLRKPIDNGDIFFVSDGEMIGRKFILIAQECDLMVRGETGIRGAKTASLVEIETITEKQLIAQMSKKYGDEIKKGKFMSHFFEDKFKLEYFESGTSKIGLVHFRKAVVIDLNVLDLIVFNESGEAQLDISNSTYNENYHNAAWRKRYDLLREVFNKQKTILDAQYSSIESIEDQDLKTLMKIKFNYLFSFNTPAGIQISYNSNKFSFGIKRISRLREPRSKYLLDQYYKHLSRASESHDFAN